MKITYLGDNIADLRKQSGISQEEFADKLKVSRQAVSKWERNEAYPDTENLIAISNFFNVKIDELINKDLTSNGIDQKIDCEEVAGEQANCETQSEEQEQEQEQEQILPSKQINDFKKKSKGTRFGFWMSLPYPIIITIIYMIWGFLAPNGFMVGWTLYLTVPVYYTIFPAISGRSTYVFCYPALVTFIFLLFGMLYCIWHPLWVIYLTVPLYYCLAPWLDKLLFKKHK